MNNYSYPFIPNNNLNILEELIKINETLKRIEKKLNNQEKNKQNNYWFHFILQMPMIQKCFGV